MLSTQLLTHYRQLSQQPFTVVDVETTGRYPSHDRVIELSVLRATLVDGILQQQTDLVNPQMRIPSNIIQFTGITQKMVEYVPAAAEIFPSYWPLLNAGVLTAHNLEFDYPFLQAEYDRLGTVFNRPESQQLCTVQLSRLMLPDLPSRRLPKLVKHFRFNVDTSHRAEADALACWLLLERLLTEILNESDEVLLARFAKQWMPLKYAAKLLGCSPQEGQIRLNMAGISSRFVGRGKMGTFMYRRGEVEQVFYEQLGNAQLTSF
ncbi:3'-5' exonuclease [Thermocoleostomius sinensis]|uniref:3'-5' exonuclease n=1 Tax=Thermocoleostomius sinensis A174 TaxID=2016057 RepID=A0A9E9C326_9CYAN|nr:3'-5' exonuclease [Thermocoleostomius sinensis]WAL58516.1 3'-5' exonuclease [Thermocoleostomius sinensis A174]